MGKRTVSHGAVAERSEVIRMAKREIVNVMVGFTETSHIPMLLLDWQIVFTEIIVELGGKRKCRATRTKTGKA